jgi:hypothetical protein
MIEVAVGVGLGLAALAHEGISFATLKQMPEAEERELPEAPAEAETVEADAAPTRARVSR